MEEFYINKDNTVDVVIDITTNNIVTLSPELFEEVAHALSEREHVLTYEEREEVQRRTFRMLSPLTEEENEALNEQAKVEREFVHDGDDTEYDNAKQDGLIN